MKKALTSLITLLVTLQSCVVGEDIFYTFSNEEIIEIDPDQKGIYTLKFDLNDLLKVYSEKTGRLEGFKSLDTIISFNSFLPHSTDLSDNERTMFVDGTAKIVCNFLDNKCSVSIRLKYNSKQELDYDREHILNFITNNIEYVFTLIVPLEAGEKKGNINFKATSPYGSNKPETTNVGLNPVGKAFSLEMNEHFIESKLSDFSVFEKIVGSSAALQKMRNPNELYDNTILKTTIVSNREIKSYKGSLPVTSSDKKSVTFSSTLTELLNKPERLNFHVSF